MIYLTAQATEGIKRARSVSQALAHGVHLLTVGLLHTGRPQPDAGALPARHAVLLPAFSGMPKK